jgi:hypothetical protein
LTVATPVRNVFVTIIDREGGPVMAHDPGAASASLVPGRQVAVRTRFDGTWAEGFRVCRERGGRYLVERCSDGSELPSDFDVADLRPESDVGASGAG